MTDTKRGLARLQKAERELAKRNRPKALNGLPKPPKCACLCHGDHATGRKGHGGVHPNTPCICRQKLPIPGVRKK